MKPSTHRFLILVTLLAGRGELLATESWDTLLTNSPFGGNAQAAVAAPAAGAPEFRGYFSEGGEQFFSVYDPGRKRAIWLRQGEKSEALTARRFDPAAQVLNVEFEGRTLLLPLKQAMLQVSAGNPQGKLAAMASDAAAPRAEGAGAEEIQRAEQALALVRQQQAYEVRRKAAEDKVRRSRAARTLTTPGTR